MTISKQPNAPRKHRNIAENFPLHYGRQIAAARALAGLSQIELAAMGGWHSRTVRLWEAAPGVPTSHRPHLDRLIAIFAKHGIAFSKSPLGVHVIAA
jgi:DNA-binding transcriptional regulator YiaG